MNLFREIGLAIDNAGYQLIKKAGKKSDTIPRHNHPEANILFTVVKGKIKVFLDDVNDYIVEPGVVLSFDGNHYINAEFLEDSEVFVTLIRK